jgi:O-antigen ligase
MAFINLPLTLIRRYPAAIVGFYCTTPFAYEISLGPTSVHRISLAFVLAAGIYHIGSRILIKHRRKTFGGIRVLLWLGAFFIWTFINIYLPEVPAVAAGLDLMHNTLDYGVLPAVVLLVLPPSTKAARHFVYGGLLGGLTNAAALFLLLLGGINIYIAGDERLALGGNTHITAVAIGLSALLSAYLASSSDLRRSRFIFLMFVLIFLFLMFLIQSIHVLIALGVASTFYIFLVRIRARFLIVGFVCLILSLGLGIFGLLQIFPTSVGGPRLTAFFLNPVDSGAIRLILYRVAIDTFIHNPLIGVGTGVFESTFLEVPLILHGLGTSPHNFFLDVAVQGGLVSLVLIGGFIFAGLRGGIFAMGHMPNRELSALALTLFVFTIVQCQFSGGISGTYHMYWTVTFMVWLGMAAKIESQLARPNTILKDTEMRDHFTFRRRV